MKTLTLAEFHAELKALGVTQIEDVTFICPMCKTVQSGRDLIEAGAGKNIDEVEKYLAFSCVGRFTGAPSPRTKPDGKPCNWTLGGLFQLHELRSTTGYSDWARVTNFVGSGNL